MSRTEHDPAEVMDRIRALAEASTGEAWATLVDAEAAEEPPVPSPTPVSPAANARRQRPTVRPHWLDELEREDGER